MSSTDVPLAASVRMMPSSRSASSLVSAAVGSSITISRAPRAIARITSTICCAATPHRLDRGFGRQAKPGPLVQLVEPPRSACL